MSVSRKQTEFRHPDTDKLVVDGESLEVHLRDLTADDVEAIRTMLTAASDAGRADFDAAVRSATATAAARAVRLHESQRKPRGSRRPRLDRWLDKQLSDDPRASDKRLWRLANDADVLKNDAGVLKNAGEELTLEGFGRRATAARKRTKTKNSR
jgi:hypothetical protein